MNRQPLPTRNPFRTFGAALVLAAAGAMPVLPLYFVPPALADSGTADPSDSGTDGFQEDEPGPPPNQPGEAPGKADEERAAPPDGDFGCPVRDRGPFPMLV